MFFSELHVQILARGVLEPGEQLVGQAVTDYTPVWAFGLIRRQHLVLATNHRIIILDHRYNIFKVNQVLHSVESLPLSGVAHAKVTGFLLAKKLKVRGMNDRGQQIDISAKLPRSLFAPMKDNLKGARNIEAAFQSRGQNAPALGMPQQTFGQLAAVVNAPGYVSTPPGPNVPGAAPPRFEPPRHY